MIEQQNPYGAPPTRPLPGPEARRSAGPAVKQVILTALLVVLAFGSGWFGNAFANRNNTAPGNDKYAQALLQAYNAISDGYVDTNAISHQKMAYAAIAAMVNSLGDTGHSRFETPDEVKQENSSLQDAPTVGIGVFLSGGGQQPLRIDEVIPGSAADGKLTPGDIIQAVNGTDVTGKTIDQVRPLILGADGTQVTLTIQRHGQDTPLTVVLTRKPFTVPLVSSYVIPGVNLAFIQLTQFAENSANASDSTDAELRQVLKQPDVQHASGIILDLRENPGGYLDQAIKVASEFVPVGSGHNVYIERTRSSSTPKPVQTGGLATNVPLTILVNGDTASAAEIVTAAIAYNRPMVHVVGEHTFGTDTILTPVPLADGSVVLLGTLGWLTPAGKNIHATGIVPDQIVALPDGATAISPILANEEHLTGDQVTSSDDPQLQQAIKDLAPAAPAQP